MRQVPKGSLSPLRGKRILLGVTGSVAAQKTIVLAEKLLQQGALIKIILTASALKFIQADDFLDIPQDDVFTDIFAEDISVMHHISLAKWADVFLIVPASAAVISRCATGLADQLISLVYTATTSPTFIVPAMNQQMWANHAVQKNVDTLKLAGCEFLGPAFGEQACGDIGWGRMLAVEDILRQLSQYFQRAAHGLRVLITAGPTQEALDPVRYFSNHSSGKMGYALADAFNREGAEVTLISGPTSLVPPNVRNLVNVISAQQMQTAVIEHLQGQQVAISAAAIADYRPLTINTQKIKKHAQALQIDLVKNPDILKTIREIKQDIYLVGFALETKQLVENAEKKLFDKNLNMIIANEFSENNRVFSANDNQVHIIEKDRKPIVLIKQKKQMLANKLVKLICSRLVSGNY